MLKPQFQAENQIMQKELTEFHLVIMYLYGPIALGAAAVLIIARLIAPLAAIFLEVTPPTTRPQQTKWRRNLPIEL